LVIRSLIRELKKGVQPVHTFFVNYFISGSISQGFR